MLASCVDRRGDGGERMTHGVKHVHPGGPVTQGAGYREDQVDVPQGLGRLGDSRGEFGVLHGARGFRPVELHAADTQHGQYRHRQHDDAHAAQPLELLPVIPDRQGQVVDADDGSRAGGGQARHRLEHGVRVAEIRVPGQHQRQGAGQPHEHPAGRHHQETVTQPQLPRGIVQPQPKRRSGDQQDCGARRESHGLPVGGPEADQRGWKHGDAGGGEQHGQDQQDRAMTLVLHVGTGGHHRKVALTWNNRSTSPMRCLSTTNSNT